MLLSILQCKTNLNKKPTVTIIISAWLSRPRRLWCSWLHSDHDDYDKEHNDDDDDDDDDNADLWLMRGVAESRDCRATSPQNFPGSTIGFWWGDHVNYDNDDDDNENDDNDDDYNGGDNNNDQTMTTTTHTCSSVMSTMMITIVITMMITMMISRWLQWRWQEQWWYNNTHLLLCHDLIVTAATASLHSTQWWTPSKKLVRVWNHMF